LRMAFEYNGELHYNFIKRFHKTEAEFHKQQSYDREKKNKCEQVGIDLKIIPYYINTSDKDLYNFISKQIGSTIAWSESFFDHFYASQKSKIEEMDTIAKERDGLFLSQAYMGCSKKHQWECKYGHQWEAKPANIKKGSWCPECSHKKLWSLTRNTLKDLETFAAKFNGKIISTKYVNNKTLLNWSCENGHIWESTLNAMKTRINKSNKWCLECHRRIKCMDNKN